VAAHSRHNARFVNLQWPTFAMDNLTHTLAAIAISQTGLNRKTRFATLTLIVAGNAPDLDLVWSCGGSIAYLQHHRGFTHSLPGIVIFALLIWGFLLWIGRRVKLKPGPPLSPRWLLGAGLLGTGSHLLLDFTNAYGVRPYLPFSGRWYAWDIMFIFDPLLISAFILGLGIPFLLRLVSEELGARRARPTMGAAFCLSAMVILWGVRDFAHRRALGILDSRTFSGEVTQRLSALPTMVNPFTWTGVVETQTSFHMMRVNALRVYNPLEEMDSFQKPQASPTLDAATTTRAAEIFLDFARYPWVQVDEKEYGYRVSFSDLRFYSEARKAQGFTLEVELDPQLKQRSENLYFTAPRRN
jgi:inner membrane protein